MKHTFFSDGIFLDAPLNRICWKAAIVKNKETKHWHTMQLMRVNTSS